MLFANRSVPWFEYQVESWTNYTPFLLPRSFITFFFGRDHHWTLSCASLIPSFHTISVRSPCFFPYVLTSPKCRLSYVMFRYVSLFANVNINPHIFHTRSSFETKGIHTFYLLPSDNTNVKFTTHRKSWKSHVNTMDRGCMALWIYRAKLGDAGQRILRLVQALINNL
jgi:hypothetical protein